MINYPNFLAVGPGKTGTTSLYNYLKQHPDIYISPRKETRFFFSEEYFKGIHHYHKKYFKEMESKHKAIGEMSTQYFFLEYCRERIKEFNPEAKIIITIRNPVDRFISLWKMGYKLGNRPVPFSEYWRRNQVFFEQSINFAGIDGFELMMKKYYMKGDTKNWDFGLYSSLYAEHIKSWWNYFGRQNVLILLFDDLLKDPLIFCKKICDFLNVDKQFNPEVDKAHNVTQASPLWVITKIIGVRNYRKLLIYAPSSLRKLGKYITKVPVLKKTIPDVTSDQRNMISEFFSPHTKELENLLNVDLSDWY